MPNRESMDLNFIPDIEYLIFGRFHSDLYGSYNIYKLTKTKLLIDSRNNWHNCRHETGGYRFEGAAATDAMFHVAKELLHLVPRELLTSGLKPFYTTGNKDEDKLIIEISVHQAIHQITIDDYETETNSLPPPLRDFRLRSENILQHLSALHP